MNKFALALAATVVSFSGISAHAGGWGGSTGSLVNVSPSVKVGDVKALNNILSGNILSGNSVASGNVIGNITGNTTGILNGNSTGILGIGSYKVKK